MTIVEPVHWTGWVGEVLMASNPDCQDDSGMPHLPITFHDKDGHVACDRCGGTWKLLRPCTVDELKTIRLIGRAGS